MRLSCESGCASTLDIAMVADNIDELDTFLVLYGPDGDIVLELDDGFDNTNSVATGIELPADGEYTIEALSFQDAYEGDYTITVTLASP